MGNHRRDGRKDECLALRNSVIMGIEKLQWSIVSTQARGNVIEVPSEPFREASGSRVSARLAAGGG